MRGVAATGGPLVPAPVPAENVYRYDTAFELRAIAGPPGIHVEIDTHGDVIESWWLTEFRRIPFSEAYGGRPGARDIWPPRRDRPIRIEREQWAALTYDLAAIETERLRELRCRIEMVFEKEFDSVI